MYSRDTGSIHLKDTQNIEVVDFRINGQGEASASTHSQGATNQIYFNIQLFYI